MGEFNLLTLIITSVTGFLTFILGQQRGKKEIESVHLQNLEKSIEIYKTIIDDLRDEIKILNDRVEVLQSMVNELMMENHKLQSMIKK
jgi:peptidoglycan hydrolase CwlO-like protein